MDEPHIYYERTDRPIFINSCKFLLIQHYVFTWKSLSCERQEIHCNTVAGQLNAVNGFQKWDEIRAANNARTGWICTEQHGDWKKKYQKIYQIFINMIAYIFFRNIVVNVLRSWRLSYQEVNQLSPSSVFSGRSQTHKNAS